MRLYNSPVRVDVEVEAGLEDQLPEGAVSCLEGLANFLTGHLNLRIGLIKFSSITLRVCRCPPSDKDTEGSFKLNKSSDSGVINLMVCGLENNIKMLMDILAHEFVHAKQFAYGELEYAVVPDGKGSIQWAFLWQGRAYAPSTEPEVYLTHPWEIEAFLHSSRLVALYIAIPRTSSLLVSR